MKSRSDAETALHRSGADGDCSRRGTRNRVRACVPIATLMLLLALGPAVEAAQRICVVCEAPDALYSCSCAPQNGAGARRGRTGGALKYRCIREVAETYGHQRCKVNDTPLSACPGTVHMLREPRPVGGGTTPGQAMHDLGAQPVQAPRAADGGSDSREPKTVVELAKRAADQTQKQIEKSSETVTGAARQTWRCLSSLFDDCGSKPDTPSRSEIPPGQ